MNLIESIRPNFIEHEGFYYLEYEGEFFKGCTRCYGNGHFSYNGEHSRCYKCDDTSAKLGERLPSREAAEKWCHGKALRRDRKIREIEAKAKAACDARDARVAKLQESDPEVVEFLQEIYDAENEMYHSAGDHRKVERYSMFLRNMASNLFNATGKDFTENMLAATRNAVAQSAQRKAEAQSHPAPEGRVSVTGEILSARMIEGDYGTTYKILVKDDQGFKVWCSIPKAQADEAFDEYYETHSERNTYGPACWLLGADGTDEEGVVGRRITFMATLQPSRDDVGFAFGKRPTKGSWL